MVIWLSIWTVWNVLTLALALVSWPSPSNSELVRTLVLSYVAIAGLSSLVLVRARIRSTGMRKAVFSALGLSCTKVVLWLLALLSWRGAMTERVSAGDSWLGWPRSRKSCSEGPLFCGYTTILGNQSY